MGQRLAKRLSDIHWVVVAPWLTVALLLHVVLVLALYVWAPSLGPPAEAVTTVAVRVGPNPYDAPMSPLPAPADDELEPVPPAPDADALAASTLTAPTVDASVPPPDTNAPKGKAAAPGGTGPPGSGGPYAGRSGPGKGAALRRFGGGTETESAVDAGLAWLAAHQRPDGARDRLHFDDRCPELDVCRETAVSWSGTDTDPAVTGLVLLAFLGGGHTPAEGPYRELTARGLRFLLSRQDARGGFGPPDRMQLYNSAIATLALSEAAAMTGDTTLQGAARRGVQNLLAAQQACGGWDYTIDVRTGRCDLSVSGWAVMALKAASAAGIALPAGAVSGIVDLTQAHTTADGTVFYANRGTGTVEDRAAGALTRRFGPAMTAVGMLVRQLLGQRRDADVLETQSRLLLSELPDVRRLRGGDRTGLHSEYYWYYGTLAAFHQGGEVWTRWNDAIQQALLSTQDRAMGGLGNKRHSYGSWSAFGRGWGKWGRAGGRVYSTALAVLCLEVYYRYPPAFLSADGLLDEHALRAGLVVRAGSERELWTILAGDMPVDIAEPVLVDWLADADARVRLRAGLALARFDSPAGRAVLEALLPTVSASEQAALRATLDRLDTLVWPRRYGAVVRLDPAGGLVVFTTLGGGTYVGQRLRIVRGGITLATVRVTRRRPDLDLAAGTFEPVEGGTSPPVIGDRVGVSEPPP